MPDDDWKDMLRDVLGDMPGFDPGLKKQMLRSLDEEDKKSVPPPPDPNVQYFEQERPDGTGACSWDPCPCSGRGTTISRGTGHLYTPQSAADFRRDCLTWRELMTKLNRMADRLPPGERLMFADVPVLVCERGLALLDIDPTVAAEDAKYWWRTGMIPLRATAPKSQEQRKREQEETEKKRQRDAEAKQRAEETKRAEEAKRAEDARKREVQSKREAAKVCIMCGKPFGFFQRLSGTKQHKECKTFSE